MGTGYTGSGTGIEVSKGREVEGWGVLIYGEVVNI